MNRKEIKLLKNNEKRDWEDLEWINEFYEFLQGNHPVGIHSKFNKLSQEDAFTIIWYLQEKLPVFPDHIERCDVCGDLYDAYNSGYYSEESNDDGQHYFCNAHEHLAPIDDDNS